MALHFLEELILHLGKRFVAHSLRVYADPLRRLPARLRGLERYRLVTSVVAHDLKNDPRIPFGGYWV
jgi:hypothetical protein